MRGTGPEGATLAYTSRYSGRSALLAKMPEVRSPDHQRQPRGVAVPGLARLKDWDERERSQQQIAARDRPQLRRIAGVQAFASNPGSFGQRGSVRPSSSCMQTSGTYEELQDYADMMLERIRAYPGLESIDTDLKLNTPEFRIEIDRAKVADLGLDVTVVGRTLETLLGGRQVTRFEQNGEQYDVYRAARGRGPRSPADAVDHFPARAAGEMIQLSNVVTVSEAVAPKELKRFNQLRSATISANLAPGYALGDGLTFLEQTAREVLPADGADRLQRPEPRYPRRRAEPRAGLRAGAGLHLSGAGGAVRELPRPADHPADVPLSMTGALGALYLSGGTLNVYLADRPGHAGRPDHQARHPDRRVRQPAAGAGA